MDKVELARYFDQNKNITVTITVREYQNYLKNKSKPLIADFIVNRLMSRYIVPYQYDKNEFKKQFKNGFSMMASYCLLVETLQSFKKGWGDSDRRSGKAFKQYFTNNKNFPELEGMGTEIYKSIRCGILHQGETTNGWRITREGTILYKQENKVLDAVIFGRRLENSISEYKKDLLKSEWDSELWDNFRTKMRKTISHCRS